jgi:putative flippase GtrA
MSSFAGWLKSAFHGSRPLRFLVIGAINTAFSYGVYAAMIFAGLGLAWASLVSFVAGIAFGFVTQGRIVFPGGGKWAFARFLAVWAALYVVFIVVVRFAEQLGIGNYAGGAIATLVVAVLSYVLQSRYVFKPDPH